MPIKQHEIKQHYLLLAGIIILSTALRFTGLAAKPLWLDEILTTLFSLGHSFHHIPLDRIFSLAELPNIFTFNPQATCPQIAETVSRESTHPPVFFCLLHSWLGSLKPTATLPAIVWQVRSLPAFFGVATVAAIYFLGRVAFSPNTGLIAAAFMAVSPFAVYLSQEARHYTLPLLFITLSLTSLIQIQRDFTHEQKNRQISVKPPLKRGVGGILTIFLKTENPIKPKTWIPWVIFNTIGLYIHYFFILVLAAQIGAICLWQLWQTCQTVRKTERFHILSIIQKFILSILPFSFCGLPLILFLPWVSVLVQHSSRQETEWFKPFEPSWLDYIVPIYQIIMGWVLMAIALPVENQPLWIAIPSGLFMVGFAIVLGRYFWQKLPQLYNKLAFQQATMILSLFTLLILAEFLIIVYILGKDITSAVRYHFIYYPSICVLLAACFTHELTNEDNSCQMIPFTKIHPTVGAKHSVRSHPLKILTYIRSCFAPASKKSVILIGLLSSILVVGGLVFQKPYHPALVAKHLNLEPEKPLMVIVGYENFQEVALGLGFAYSLYRQRHQTLSPPTYWLFADRTEGYHTLWPKLPTLENLPPNQAPNLWIVAPGLRQREYPENLLLSSSNCTIDRNQYYRIGIPYQLYRCSKT
jgi:uncharacterized membrane protein